MIAAPGPVHPWPIGVGARYQPAAANAAVSAGRPVGRLTCSHSGRTFAVHVELFAHRRVVIVPPGIGVGPHGCAYPLATDEPTGVVARARAAAGTSSATCSASGVGGSVAAACSRSTGRVSVYVGGRLVTGDPRTVPLRRHAQIVVEVGGYVAPHPTYLFPKGTG